MGENAESCAFVDFSKGQSEGFLRFKESDSNKVILEKIEGKLKVRICIFISIHISYTLFGEPANLEVILVKN